MKSLTQRFTGVHRQWPVYVFLSLLALLMLFPVLTMALSSLMGPGELRESYGAVLGAGGENILWKPLPQYPTLQPFVELLLDSPDFFVMFWNSCRQVFPILLGQTMVGMPAAWAFARYRFPGRKVLFWLYMVLMVMPFQVTMVSSYLVLSRLSLMDTHLAICLPGIFSTFPVFIMTRFFSDLPDEWIEAARIDGAGSLQLLWHICIPAGKPGIAAVTVLMLLETWNTVEQPLFFLKDPSLFPLSLFFPALTADNFGSSFAAAIMMLLPPVLVFLCGRQELEAGIGHLGIEK